MRTVGGAVCSKAYPTNCGRAGAYGGVAVGLGSFPKAEADFGKSGGGGIPLQWTRQEGVDLVVGKGKVFFVLQGVLSLPIGFAVCMRRRPIYFVQS
jgi:hypothetical protein